VFCFAGYKTIPEITTKLNYFNMLLDKISGRPSRHFAKGSVERKIPFLKKFESLLHSIPVP